MLQDLNLLVKTTKYVIVIEAIIKYDKYVKENLL